MDYRELYLLQRRARLAGDCEQAIRLLDVIHRECHDRPLMHVRVHWAWALAYGCLGRYGRSAWELFAMVFAAPVSLVQRYLGLSRKL